MCSLLCIVIQGYRLFLFTEGRLKFGPIYVSRNQLGFNFTKIYPATTFFVVIDALYQRSLGPPVSIEVTTPTGHEPVPDKGATGQNHNLYCFYLLTVPQQAVSSSAAVINDTLVTLSWPAVPTANVWYKISL